MTEFARHRQAAEQQRRVAEQAASWYLDLREGLDEAQRQAFADWLRESPVHVAEYLAMTRLHGDMGAASALDPLGGDELRELARHERAVVPLRLKPAMAPAEVAPRHRWRAALAQVAAVLMVTLLGGGAWLYGPPPGWDAYASAPDTLRSVRLPDGTDAQLDRASVVAVHFDARQRHIEIIRGGALFDVGHDPARPLTVRLGANELQDIGTVFDAHQCADGGTVTVISGRVRIWQDDAHAAAAHLPSAHGAPVAELASGQQANLRHDGSLDLVDRHADLARSTGWLPADIHFEHASVAEVARRFNAYNPHPLVIEDAAIAATRISGHFHARDMESFVAYLGTLPGVRVTRSQDDIRVASTRAASPMPRSL